MKILVSTTFLPFHQDYGSLLADRLAQALAAQGHDVDTIKIPFRPNRTEMAAQTLMLRLLDVDADVSDLLITLRFPSYALHHRHKIVWLLDQYHPAYTLTLPRRIPETSEGRQFQQDLIKSDSLFLHEARAVYAMSQCGAARLQQFNQVSSKEVLYPPLLLADTMPQGDLGDYLLVPHQIAPYKRQMLLLDALNHAHTDIRLVILGDPLDSNYLAEMQACIVEYDLTDRVRVIMETTREKTSDLFAHAYAIISIAQDEDYPAGTIHAFGAKKPVITCNDSGAPNEFVHQDQTGLSVAPEAEALADAICRLTSDHQFARTLGSNAYDFLNVQLMSWDTVAAKLVGTAP